VGHLFQWLCVRPVNLRKTQELETFVAEAICLLKLNFLP
jgi:hypothetical protein